MTGFFNVLLIMLNSYISFIEDPQVSVIFSIIWAFGW